MTKKRRLLQCKKMTELWSLNQLILEKKIEDTHAKEGWNISSGEICYCGCVCCLNASVRVWNAWRHSPPAIRLSEMRRENWRRPKPHVNLEPERKICVCVHVFVRQIYRPNWPQLCTFTLFWNHFTSIEKVFLSLFTKDKSMRFS